ncbi:response regulator [Paenibacillus rigui]|uniref:Response regulatory domain-containing protein n=1 Tax=Paenibacillus rigui TaxID=554312 RepID=A0A229UMI2_9BACL|nr:response regulator [Paenibacillus rigui]OXM84505.1 hypothetical protein CF651_20340 [Paenibacillus rigui]
MFNVVLVEDEIPILELMKVIVGRNPNYNIIGTFNNPLDALSRIPELQPDIAFLDIEMPKLNGLELAQQMADLSEHTRIVFTTAYKEYALDAFKVYAFDYILKPVTPDAIERITARLLKLESPPALSETQPRLASIRCFGGFEVRNAQGSVVRWPTRKTEELFAYFLSHPNQDISKWHLADRLWPHMNEERVSHNLHNTIYRLKKILKEHNVAMEIVKTSEGYLLDTQKGTYDLLEFQHHEACSMSNMNREEHAAHLYSLYRGPLFEGKDYLWKVQLEEVYSRQYAALVRSLVLSDMEQKQWERAKQKLDTYLSVNALDEEMHLLFMDMYIRSGRLEQIPGYYREVEALFYKELGVAPLIKMKNKIAAYL